MKSDADKAASETWPRDTGILLGVGCAVLGLLILTGVWSSRTWWATAMDLSGNSAMRTVLILVFAPLVACGTLMSGIRGDDAWTSGRKWRITLYVGLTVVAVGGCIVLPGTNAGREFVTAWLL